jgi:catechol 2,3-dioxygenase-like lactoylglutathione lyase family enzyme
MIAHFILYVDDQQASEQYWTAALDLQPRLSVPGMTEYEVSAGAVIGLMPAAGIRQLLGDRLPDPASASGVPRAEVYLLAADAQEAHDRALAAGGRELAPVEDRPWGHRAGYVLTPDGHVLAHASDSSDVRADRQD